MVLLSRVFLHLTKLTPMQRFYVVVGVLVGVVLLQLIIIIIGMHFLSKSPNVTNPENSKEGTDQNQGVFNVGFENESTNTKM
mgnify:CR=1 FL=1